MPPSDSADSENQLFYDAVRAEAAKDFDSAIRFYEQSAKKISFGELIWKLSQPVLQERDVRSIDSQLPKALLLPKIGTLRPTLPLFGKPPASKAPL